MELLDGKILDLAPIERWHAGTATYLNQIFVNTRRNRWLMTVQNPVRLDDYSEPQPDLLLLQPDPDFYRRRHRVPAELFLLVEIADSSLTKDRELKLPA